MADRAVVYRLRAEVGQFKAQMAQAGASVKDAADKMTAANKDGEKFRRGLTELSSTSGQAGLALGAAFGVMVAKAANFEQAMSFVQAATHESAATMQQLEKAALDAGAQTSFSATEAAGAIEELAKAGVSTEAILNGGLNGALDLAAAGGLEVAAAAEAAASAMTQFGLSGDQVPHIADLLAAGAGKAQGSVADMSAALNQSGLVAAQTGLSIEEATGALSAFASAGLTGSDAGTSFKTMLQALTPSSKEAAKLMDQLGITAYDAQGNFVGLVEFADSLRTGLADLSTEQQNAALKTIFGADAVRAASVIYEQGASGIQSWIDKTNDAGYASETAGIRMDNLKGDLEGLGGALETLLITGGDGQTGFLRGLTQGATDFVNAINDLPGPIKSVGGSLLGLAALGAGGFWFTGKVISTVASTREALSSLSVSGTKASKALKGLGVAAGVFVGLQALAAGIREIQSATMESLPGVETLTGRLIDLASGRVSSLGDEFDSVGESIDRIANKSWDKSISDSLQGVAGKIFPVGDAKSLETARQEIEALDSALTNLQATAGTDAAERAFTALADSAGLSADQVSDLRGLLPGFTDALSGAKNEAKLAAGATSDMGDALATATPLTADMAKALQDARDGAYETARGFVNLGESLNDPKVSLRDWIGELEAQGRALRRFQRNAETAARKGLDEGLVQSLQNAGVEGAMRLEQLAGASQREIRRANRAFKTGQSASDAFAGSVEDLARKVLGLPSDKKVDIKVNGVSGALSAIAVMKRELAGIRDKTVTVTINGRRTNAAVGTPGDLGNLLGGSGSADGSTVPKDGGPYADRYPYLLAPGEEVISNRFGQADRHRDLLKAINAGRLADGGTVGLANGGTATRSSSADGSVGGGLKGLARALRESERALDRERDKRDALTSKMTDLRSAVGGSFVSDLFGSDRSPWSSGGAFEDALGTLRGDIATGRSLAASIAALRKKGLSGGALDTLLSSASPQQVAEFAGRSSGELAQYAQLISQRASLSGSVGRSAADAAYGAQRRRQQAVVEGMAKRVDRIEKVLREEGAKNRKSNRKGARKAASSRSRGYTK